MDQSSAGMGDTDFTDDTDGEALLLDTFEREWCHMIARGFRFSGWGRTVQTLAESVPSVKSVSHFSSLFPLPNRAR